MRRDGKAPDLDEEGGPDDGPPPPPPDARALAELLSVAVSIEPELVRAVRIGLLPRVDVGAESDLWFSTWVGSRGPRSMVLRADVQRTLRRRLAARLADGEPLGQLRRLVRSTHGHLPPLTRLEEEVTWLALGGEPQGLGKAEQRLRTAFRALVDEGRTGVADWLAGVCRRLPDRLLYDTVTGWQVRSVAAFLDPDTGGSGMRAPGQVTRMDAALVRDAVSASEVTEVPEEEIPVHLHRGRLTVGHGAETMPGARLIVAPGTEPVVLELLLPEAAGGGGRHLAVYPGEQVVRTGCPSEMRLATAAHQVYVPADASPAGGQEPDAASARPRTMLLGRRPERHGFSRWVYDRLRDRLEADGCHLWDLSTLHPSAATSGTDGTEPWPVTFDAVVVLLDRVEVESSTVRGQLRLLERWGAAFAGPRPLLVDVDGMADRWRRAGLADRGNFAWITPAGTRFWSADHPRGGAQAREVASEALQAVRAIGSGAPHPFPTRAQMLAFVADLTLARYRKSHRPEQLDRALIQYGEARSALRLDVPIDAEALVRYAGALLLRAEETRSRDDAEHSADVARQVLGVGAAPGPDVTGTGVVGTGAGTAQDRLTQRRALLRLLSALQLDARISRAEHGAGGSSGSAGFDTAVALGRTALDEERLPSRRTELLAHLAAVAANPGWLRGHPERTGWAARLNLEAAGPAGATGRGTRATERVRAAGSAALLAIDAGDMPLAGEAFERLFDLLEQCDWGGVARGESPPVRLPHGFAGFPERAAACAVAAGEPPRKALAVLERGLALHRVILAGRALWRRDSCQPEERLRDRLGREAGRLTSVRHPTGGAGGAPLPPGAGGPVVVLNASTVRSDAFVLSGGSVTAVALPGLDVAAARRWTPGDPAVRAALEPAVRELAQVLSEEEPDGVPVVSWCATGPLSRLPVHQVYAAGPTGRGGRPPGVPTIPTYTPSLTRHRSSGPPARVGGGRRRPSRALVVVSDTGGDDGWARAAEAEVAAVRGTGMLLDLLDGERVSRRAVLKAMSDCEVVHLVCRPVPPPPENRRQRGWAMGLADGPLTASDIAAADLSGTGLVFLSGYGESVGSGTEPERDTLAASLHFAGCRHVVASLTPPGPRGGARETSHGTGPLVAGFYGALLDEGRRPCPDRTPAALEEALSKARARHGREGQPPPALVHIGPGHGMPT